MKSSASESNPLPTKPFQSRNSRPSQGEERLGRSKLNAPFLIESEAEQLMKRLASEEGVTLFCGGS